MNKETLLLEVGLEEMPARFVTDAMVHLKDKTEDWLNDIRLSFDNIEAFSTPRRLAVMVYGLVEKQEDVEEEARGPAKKIALDDDGSWSKAAQGFARGQGVTTDDIFFKEVKGEEYVFVKKFTEGKPARELLAGLEHVILNLSFPKNMKWSTYDLRYVRPVKWLTVLYGKEVVPFQVTNVKTDRKSWGHRFLGGEVTLDNADQYKDALLLEHVLVSPEERKNAIRTQIERMAEDEGWTIPIDEKLLEEVTNLVEYPTALYGTFDERFLKVPEDVLITSMREHQRYFPVKNESGDLLPKFVTVRNGDHRYLENVQKGNEKVLRARLQDSEFFYEEDLKQPFHSKFSRLESIVYHEELGSVADKVRRVTELAVSIAEKAGADRETIRHTERAAHLSKVDLVTHMVDEFPELEGRMGEEYAVKSGESSEVAKAIREHYLPKQSGDPVPSAAPGAFVSTADKLDTLVTSFSIGAIPTGSQDPHGLRRQTAGILQIFLAESWQFDLFSLMDEALDICESNHLLKRPKSDILADLKEFTSLRYKQLLQDHNVRYDVADAVLRADTGRVDVTVKKAQFLMAQLKDPGFKQDVEAFSRVTNISKKSTDPAAETDSGLLKEPQEKQLFELTEEQLQAVAGHLANGRVNEAYIGLKSLAPAIHDYFDNIMVMVQDEGLKENRLAQMSETARVITSFADFQAIVFHSEEV